MRRLLKSSDFSGFDHISSQNRWFTSQNLFNRFPDFFRILFKSPVSFSFDHVSSQYWLLTSQISYDNLLLRIFIQFADFCQIFSVLYSNLQISLVLTMIILKNNVLLHKYDIKISSFEIKVYSASLHCSRSRTLSIIVFLKKKVTKCALRIWHWIWKWNLNSLHWIWNTDLRWS